MIIIRINRLHTETILGAYSWEKKGTRPVVLDLEMHITDEKAASTDVLKDAIDYNTVAEHVLKHLETTSYNLIERLATDIGHLVLSFDKRIAKVIITADKPKAFKQADSVSVSLTLDRSALK